MSDLRFVNGEPLIVVPDTERDRYGTFEFLPWWDQRKVRGATVIVVGAGALGNEVIKNLALIGVGRLLIVDFDTVEASNLTRSVLFRESDRRQRKAEVAARAAHSLNPDVETSWIHGDVTVDLGAGAYRHVDAVVGCLDNREARLHLNRACFGVGKPWVDGALHEMLGEARVFWPGEGGCYECTLGPSDYEAMATRYSCSSLARDLVQSGKVATTPTIASIIGGVQAQETLKLLHGLEVQPGKGLVFNGLTNETYTITYPCHEECQSHHVLAPIIECNDLAADRTTVRELLERVRQRLGEGAVVELDFDLLVRFDCVHGHRGETVLQPASQVSEASAACPECGSHRWPVNTHTLYGNEEFLDLSLAEIGVAPLAILCGRAGNKCCFLELTGDLERIFGAKQEHEEMQFDG